MTELVSLLMTNDLEVDNPSRGGFYQIATRDSNVPEHLVDLDDDDKEKNLQTTIWRASRTD